MSKSFANEGESGLFGFIYRVWKAASLVAYRHALVEAFTVTLWGRISIIVGERNRYCFFTSHE